jgi:hypothetical protein
MRHHVGLLLAFGEGGDDGGEIAFARGFEAGAAERVADDGEEPFVEGEAEDDPGDEGEDHPREGFAEIFEVGEERFFLVHGELVAFASDLVAELQQRGEEHGRRGDRGGAGVGSGGLFRAAVRWGGGLEFPAPCGEFAGDVSGRGSAGGGAGFEGVVECEDRED